MGCTTGGPPPARLGRRGQAARRAFPGACPCTVRYMRPISITVLSLLPLFGQVRPQQPQHLVATTSWSPIGADSSATSSSDATASSSSTSAHPPSTPQPEDPSAVLREGVLLIACIFSLTGTIVTLLGVCGAAQLDEDNKSPPGSPTELGGSRRRFQFSKYGAFDSGSRDERWMRSTAAAPFLTSIMESENSCSEDASDDDELVLREQGEAMAPPWDGA